MHENQCVFRQGYCTVDHLFTLYSFFELLKRKKKKNVLCESNKNMFIYTFIIFSISCEIVRRPVTLWFSKKSSRSFKNIANKKVYKFSPCLMPLPHGK
jgi:hypothetical protein